MGIRKFLLLSFDYLRPKDPSISLASSSIMACLREKFESGNYKEMDLFHRQYNVKNTILETINHEVMKDIGDIQPDMLATGLYVWNEPVVNHIFQHLHGTSHRPRYIILGGPQITYSPIGTLESSYPYADIFIRGYAEESLRNVLTNMSTGLQHNQLHLDGIHFRGQNDKVMKSPYMLSTLPSPLLMPDLVDHKGYIRWETKRGCPFECSFCQHKDSYEKRLKCSPTRISDEITWMSKNGIKDISVVDPIYNSGGVEYLENLRYLLEQTYKGRLNMQARFEMIRPDFLELCSALQEGGATVELEFGIQTVVKKESQVIRRLNNLKGVVQSANELHIRNIPFEVSLIYGLPEQTYESFQFSIEWVKEFLKPARIRAWPLMLLKGTGLYDTKELYNIREKILDEDLEELDKTRQYKGIPHVVESSSFTETDWDKMKLLGLSINSLS